MAKRAYKKKPETLAEIFIEQEDEEVALVESEPASYNKVELVNRISAKVRLEGSITGELYEWERAGAVVAVDERDAPDLLSKKLGEKHCCGGSPNMIFEIKNN